MGLARTWIGGDNNQIANTWDWFPAGAPQAGDSLAMRTGVMNISDYDLPSGDYLGVTGDVTLSLSHHSSFVAVVYSGTPEIHISGKDTLVLGSAYLASPVVDLANHAKWIGNFNVDYTSAALTVNGGPKAKFINESSISGPYPLGGESVAAGRETINVAVAGTGGFRVPSGNLTFGRSVGPNQNVDISGLGHVTVDDPAQFHALTNLSGGEIDLMGLATTDSFTYENDMLSIFGGSRLIDALRLTNQAQYGFDVVKTASSVNIVALTFNGEALPGALPVRI
jgi:hypothetical protein